jgi:hypothetical protein
VRRRIEVAAGTQLSCKQSDKCETHPLTKAEWLEELTLRMLKGERNGICGRDRHRAPPRWSVNTKLLRTVAPIKSHFVENGCLVHPLAERRYSYRSASTGSSFEALTAGTKPLITPTKSSAAVDSKTVMMDILKWISP